MTKSIYTWKKNLKPQVLLDNLSEITHTTSEGKVSFSGWNYHEIIASLESMVDVKKVPRDLYLPTLLSKAINLSAKEKLDSKIVLEKLNNLAKEQLANQIKKYRVLTSLSMQEPLSKKQFQIGKSTIKFSNNFPKKYQKSRKELLSQLPEGTFEFDSDRHYSKIVIYTKAKSTHGAITQALEDLDLLRGLLCLFTNYQMEMIGNIHKPINKIRLGQFHTLHEENGKAAIKKQYWFEPNFIPEKNATPKKQKLLIKNIGSILKKIHKHKDKEQLIEGVVRYVRSLDEKDQNTAVVKLWATLESLLSKGERNNDAIPRRISFLFEKSIYHYQIIEHIRNYRNTNVHSGLTNDNAKIYAFQLQNYFRTLFLFYIQNTKEFIDINTANKFLDSPKELLTIKDELHRLELALNMREGK